MSCLRDVPFTVNICISSTKSLEKTQRASPVYCMVVHLGSQKIAWGPVF